MTWRTVILTKDSKISLRLNHLVVTSDEVITVPLSEIGTVIIENPNIVMTGHILNALTQHKITTVICNDRYMPHAHINLIYGHFRQARIIKEQLAWSSLRKDMLWQEIIREKIKNQRDVLKYFMPKEFHDNFDIYIEQVELGDETNREGHAAKVYFNKLFGLTFVRDGETAINWALNYGYSLLLSLFNRIIVTKGLLTEVGVHHNNQFNYYNLASDFMEVYRPFIDVIVKNVVLDTFEKEQKRELIEIFNKKILIKDKRQYLTNSVEIYVDSLIKFMTSKNLIEIDFPNFKF